MSRKAATRRSGGNKLPRATRMVRQGRQLPARQGARERARGEPEHRLAGGSTWVRYAVAAPLIGVLAVGPFFRGLFFPGEQLVAVAVVMGTFTGFWVYSSLHRLERPQRVIEWAALALALIYWAAALRAVTPRAAVGEALKYTAYLAVLWMFARLGNREAWRLALSVTLVVTAFGLAILGLGAAAGTFSYPGAFEGGRICSSLQYPNTAATYLTAGVILASGLAGWTEFSSRWGDTLLAGGLAGVMSVIFVAFVFTMSRGGWVVFPVLLVLVGVLFPRGQRAAGLAVLAAALLAGLTVVPGLGRVLAGPRGAAVWAYVAVAFFLGVVLGALARLGLRRAARLSVSTRGGGRVRPALVALAALLVVAGMGLALGRPATVAALVPEQLRGRLAAIKLAESGAQDRMQWTRDALRLVAARPVLGAGGGGWNALYGTVQTYAYFSTEVHNHYAQLWVEAGTLGLGAFLAMWVGLLWSYWRARQVTRGPAGALLAATFVAAAGLGAHAVIDFNLSLPAVALTLWALLGLVAAAEPVSEPAGRRGVRTPWWLGVGVPVATLAILLLTVSLRVGHAAGQRGAAALNQGNLEKALVEFETARRYDPWTASFHIDLGQVYERMALKSGAPGLIERARLSYKRGVALDPYNFQYRTLYANFLLRQGEAEPALRELETAITCRPALAAGYENLAMACVRVAMSPHVDTASARRYLDRVEEVAREMEQYSRLAPPFAGARRMPPSTPRLVLALGEARVLRGDLAAARASLEEAAKQAHLKPEANLFLAAWARLSGEDPAPFLKEAASIEDAALQAEFIAQRARTLMSGS